MPYFSTILSACVPFPAPGSPINTKFIRIPSTFKTIYTAKAVLLIIFITTSFTMLFPKFQRCQRFLLSPQLLLPLHHHLSSLNNTDIHFLSWLVLYQEAA